MAETTSSKVEKWAYPLKAGASEVTDSMQYYKALAKAKDGYYPLGSNGLWHGGVHFDEDTGLVADKSEVRCIADGEVVAYRIDEKYPTSNYGSTPSVFSTGFVLVKHRLELSAPPAPAGSPPPAAGPSLTFFSLYMHLLDWEGYKANPTLKRPAFWGKDTYQVKANAPDKSLGLRVRSGNSGQTSVLTVLPRGTTVNTKPAPATQKWLEIVSVTPEVAALPANTGWVFKGEMQHLSGDIYFVGEQAKDAPPEQKTGANIRSATARGLPIGFLPTGTQIKISNEQASGKYRKLLEIVTGESIPALTPGADGTLPGYVWLDSLEPKSEPKTPGVIVPLTPVHKIKAGELIGHVGKYQNYSDAAPKNLLHLEVFSCEDIKAFIDQTKEQAVRLPATEKTLVKILPDTPLITHVPGMNASNPPKANDASKKVGYGLLIPVSVLEALPAEKKIKAPVVMNGVTTYTQWWHLEGLLADAQGESIDGWFAEPNTTLYRHSPFEWENFTFIEETGSNVDLYADFLHAQENMTDEERKAYHPNIVTAGAGPTKQSLYTILDRNRDTKLPSEEIGNALSKPWFAQPISQMVVKYESEWDYKAEKWDSLDELMGHSESAPHKEWVAEKARIEKLSWWGKLVGQHGITAESNVQHIHLVGMLGSFCSTGRELLTFDQMKGMFPTSSESKREEVRDLFNKYADRFEINTKVRIAQFFAQVKTEVGAALVGKSESLWYSVDALKSLFTRYFGHYPAEAEELGYKRITIQQYNALSVAAKAAYTVNGSNAYSQFPKPDEIAKRVYCCCSAEGGFVLTPGGCSEGLSYKGKGFIQLTWKSNYKAVEDVLKQKLPEENIDIVANPDQLLETKIGLLSAMGFWEWKKLNNIVAPNVESTNDITKVVNLNTESYGERRTNFTEIYQALNHE
ncbi:hypothetical protein PUP66_00305 [Pseudomonas chlororaphis]|uniref:glycoside hydrolase family 19 protein n=1 Tax=Pseudomonas chlororaphis TaxID=587753 RepID=UPI000F6F481B|nr:hypothetical protein [Pseudomonas chlororaphis]AZD18856.1 hypothetical protein C4K25_5972 [Pseudomonas chlororaphis]WDH47343.1 hypothetical protein PUP66_00305 [Pseudomonas chlororaphis]WDH59190.1 hypothetical protein PUP56_00305 [Pseudomonas chlororaphis]WQE18447.1 hypothetical protein U0007_29295 [Pseudomonas chlororaphis]